uniref:110 kDa U5 small nuclear ribonucleoprotein component CLO-like isoform X2 n=2 Tax=Hirondellea gigas TaxID=1518452 RepID=A0A6A7G5G1_9CRUS
MEADQPLYDEFGNYLGPEIAESSDEDSDEDEWAIGAPDERGASELAGQQSNGIAGEMDDDDDEINDIDEELLKTRTPQIEYDMSSAIVLHEDKQYYPSAEDVYPEAETITQLEDTQPLETPIIAPIKSKQFELVERTLPETTFSYEFLTKLMGMPDLIRNVCFLGQLHHGKTEFMDVLIQETHVKAWPLNKEIRYTDMRKDEQSRGLSIKAVPMSLILETLRGKSYLVNIMDCPGHVNFSDEQTAALRICDGAIIFVDAAEGVMKQTERAILHAVEQGIPICIVINKMDRLILELKLPPNDAYFKLAQMISDINGILERCAYGQRISPELGNVCFASSWFGWSFTLKSFAKLYADYHGNFAAEPFARRLWGDFYLHKTDRKFHPNAEPNVEYSKRAFVEFILEPLYKIYAHVVGTDAKQLEPLLDNIGVRLRKSDFLLDVKPLLRLILSKFFGHSSGFVDMIVEKIPSPKGGAAVKIEQTYTGEMSTPCANAMLNCLSLDPETNRSVPQMVNIVKLYPRPDCSAFDAFGRVLSGVVKVGDRVRVLREGFSLEDDEDMSIKTVDEIWIYQARYRIPINQVTAGNWALFGGIDSGIAKTATITQIDGNDEACIFRPLKFNTASVVKVAIEPLKPSELPKMLEALRAINKTYPLSHTKVEESGEHIILGTGELYMDCALRDLREMYSEIEIKVADPVVTFCETVLETSSIQCFAETPNKKNKLTMICEPLKAGIAEDIEQENVRIDEPNKRISSFFQQKYGWDVLASRSIWSFGPEKAGPNILEDDTLPAEVDKSLLSAIQGSIIQGFQWGTREGPLCDEPLRNTRFKLIQAEISDNPIERGGGQIIPTARRVAYSAFLLAAPRLMEPVFYVEIQMPVDCLSPVYAVLKQRRGFIVGEKPRPGTPLYFIEAYIPVIDSFGFETDLRTHTQGQAFCTSVFDHWEMVPGDPLDREVELRPLEPSPMHALAREFMTKTRKRKGLSEDVSINKYFDDPMLIALAEHEAEQDEEGYG